MRGFFTKRDVTKIRKDQEILHKQKDPCEVCGLWKTCQSPKMKYTGQGKKKILIIGEASGRTEDEDWEELGYDEPTQFIGQAGSLQRRKLKKYDIDLDRDCWKMNALSCRPPKNRKPTKREIKLCKPNIDRAIEELKPEFIWLLGGSAVESFYIGRFPNLSISRWRRLCIPDRKTNAWVLPMYHPSYLLRNETDKNLETTYNRDLKWAVSCLRKDPPEFEDFEKQITILLDFDSVVSFLRNILRKKPLIAFDYETTGLKPYEEGHKVWCIAINGTAFSYDYECWDTYQKDRIKKLWRKILLDSKIKKVAHNLKFEDMWSRNIFDVERVNGWEQCTMTTAHILDSRGSFVGLKFQAYINYGIEGYEKETKPFIAPKGKDKVNRLNEVPLAKLLKYNALDSILTLKLYEDQKKFLSRRRNLKRANDFFRDGLIAFANTQQVGIRADKEYYLEQEKILNGKIDKLEVKLLSGKEARLFKKKTGNKLKIAKDLSVKDLRILLFDVLGIKIEKKTEKAKLASVDHDVLTQINIPFTKRLLQRRKLFKVRNTYLAQFTREVVDGRIHPFFDLHTARTFRSCIAKGSKILAVRDFIKYPKGVPIEEIRMGDYVYCFDDNLNPAIKKVIWAGKTGVREIVRIHWKAGKGRKGFLDVTPEHLIRHIGGHYYEAQNLKGDLRRKNESKRCPKIRILSSSRVGDSLYFTGHIGKHGSGILEHRFIYSRLIGDLKEDDIVHHRDVNHLNHLPDNLEKMTLSNHALHHCILNDPEVRKKNLIAIKKRWKEGKYKNAVKRGEDSPNYLGLSRIDCLKLLARQKGKSSKVKYDFNTFKKYLKKYDINPKLIKLRYDKNGKHITRNRLIGLSKLGRSEVSKALGHNHYKLIELYNFYGIYPKRKWRNQFGEFALGNHTIVKVEWLNKKEDVYDIEIEDYHNFFANELCVHNSSALPNFQNIPTRDEEAKKICRSGILPSPGNKLVCIDYGSQEVRIASCYTKDPVLIEYINDPTTDMHRDQAEELFLLDDKQVTKDIRFYAKNQFVFPEFYGSWYKACASSLWECCADLKTNDNITVKKHLKNEGIRDYDIFENHVRKIERVFWEKFNVYAEWKKKVIEEYYSQGYVEMFFGHRRGGYLTNNMILNSAIQGTAFHCLLWSFIELDREFTKRKYQTKIIGQIHDEIVFDLFPEEEEEVLKLAEDVMVEKIRETHKWLIVPLSVDIETTEVDGSWYTKKKL